MTFCATRWEQLAPLVERAAVVLLVGHQGVIRAFRLHADGSAQVWFEDGYEVQVPSVKETHLPQRADTMRAAALLIDDITRAPYSDRSEGSDG